MCSSCLRVVSPDIDTRQDSFRLWVLMFVILMHLWRQYDILLWHLVGVCVNSCYSVK